MFLLLGGGLSACGGNDDDRVPIQSVTVFGDSLNDVGTYRAATGDPANPGKFTVNPGGVWVEGIAAAYGLSLKPNRSLTLDKDASFGATTQVGSATVIGGNGYAEGGARISQLPSESGVGNNQLVSPISQQVGRYLAAHGAFPPNQLVIVDGGANDTYAQFSALCWGTDDNGVGPGNTTVDIAAAAIVKAANDQVSLIKQMRNNGARLILLASAMDWTGTPFARKYLSSDYQGTGCYALVPPAQVTAWTVQFNKILSDGVAGLPGVIYLDTSAVWNDAIANPARHGFANAIDPACTNTTPTSSAAFCTAATLVSSDAAQTYFWSDAFHPTPHGHQLLADRALELLKPFAKKPE